MKHRINMAAGTEPADILITNARVVDVFSGLVRQDSVAIGDGVGSCGTAMFLREPVVVSDIMHDPLWAPYRELAAPFGLRACWSQPIFGQDGAVLGSFAMYYREVHQPDARPQAAQVSRRAGPRFAAEQADPPFAGAQRRRNDAQQGRLAGPRGADQGQPFARRHLHVDTGERPETVGVGQPDAFEGETHDDRGSAYFSRPAA